MNVSNNQILDIAIIILFSLYVFYSHYRLKALQPKINTLFQNKISANRKFQQNKFMIVINALFLLSVIFFCGYRLVFFMYSIEIDSFSIWFISILFCLYASYVLLLNSTFSKVVD